MTPRFLFARPLLTIIAAWPTGKLAAAYRCVFPGDHSVLEVKRDRGAKIFLLPNGACRVTSCLVGRAAAGLCVDGESIDLRHRHARVWPSEGVQRGSA